MGRLAVPTVIPQTEAEWTIIGDRGCPLHTEVEAQGVSVL